MNRRDFLRAAPVVGVAAVGSATSGNQKGGVHISIDPDSPFFGGVLAQRGVKEVLLNGEPVRKCVEASERDGFVLQTLHARSGTAHHLREPGAILIPGTAHRPARVKRFGVVQIEFKEGA